MHLKIRYNHHKHQITMRVTIAPDAMPALLARLHDILQGANATDPARDALHAPPERARVRDVLRDPGGAPFLSWPFSHRSLPT
jgi:hypothetical protein